MFEHDVFFFFTDSKLGNYPHFDTFVILFLTTIVTLMNPLARIILEA